MRHGTDLLTWVDDARAPVLLTLALLAGLVLLRLALLVVLDLATSLPGRLGRGAGRLGRVVRPGLAGRLLAAAVGLGATSISLVSPATAAPVTAAAARAPDHARPPARPTLNGALAATVVTMAAQTYLVRPGDSLWVIAREHLPAGAGDDAVDRAWPQWYAANRTVVGSDPALIRPGMRLCVPDLRPTGTSATQHHRPAPTTTATPAWVLSLDPDRR